MKLNPRIPLSDKFQSRIAAQAIVYHGFDMSKAVAELRPDIKYRSSFGQKLMAEPAVLNEIEVIMDRTENNAQKFLKLMWEWLEGPDASNPMDKAPTEKRLTAARILAKGYISEKKGGEKDAPSKPMVIEGLGEGVTALTGDPADSSKGVIEEKDPRKVV
jgi:hypothetical protein